MNNINIRFREIILNPYWTGWEVPLKYIRYILMYYTTLEQTYNHGPNIGVMSRRDETNFPGNFLAEKGDWSLLQLDGIYIWW